MTRRSLLLGSILLVSAGVAPAATISYLITVGTSGLSGPGYIDLEFNQANSLTSLSATASITQFTQTGFTFGSALRSAGVTGDFETPPLVIPNDQSAANFYTRSVSQWGSVFSFLVTLSGPAVGSTAQDGSEFAILLLDSTFAPKVSPLPGDAAAVIILNGNGSVSASGSTFPGGFATVAAVPEPATAMIALAGFGLIALRIRRR